MPFFSTFYAFINILPQKKTNQVAEIQVFAKITSTKSPLN